MKLDIFRNPGIFRILSNKYDKVLIFITLKYSIFKLLIHSKYSKRYTQYLGAVGHIYMYIKAYAEYMAYSGIFRTVDIFSHFQTRYSGITQEQFMHILKLI